ncbi:MAG: AsmA family protein [Gammaproteobacteria bacterium]|nr:AsmA family protein [Gammaproteobacteria bacterium]
MKSTGRRILYSLVILLALTAVLVAAAVFLIDAKTIQKRLNDELAAQTGQQLHIDGDTQLEFFPRLAIRIDKIRLRSLGKQRDWLTINRLAGQVDIWRLVSGELVINSFLIDQPVINLILAKFPESSAKDTAKPTSKAADGEKNGKPMLIGVRQIKINKGVLNWAEKPELGQLDLHTFTANNDAPGKPIHMSFDTTLTTPDVAHSVPLKGAFTVDLGKSDQYQIKPLNLKLDQSSMTGSINIQDGKTSRIQFDLELDTLDVDRYTQADAASQPAAGKPAASKPVKAKAGKQEGNGAIIDGKIRVKQVRVAGINITDTDAGVHFANDQLSLKPFSTRISNGQMKGTASVDLRGNDPVIRLDQSMKGVDIGQLLRDLKVYHHFKGNGDIKLAINTRGGDVDPLLKNLDGNVSFNLGDSSFNDMDFLGTAQKLQKLYDTLKGKEVSEKPVKAKAVYDTVSGSLQFNKGIGTTNDLLIARKDSRITGSGTISPGYDDINIALNVVGMRDDKPVGSGIPLRIKKPLSDPRYMIDRKEATKMIKKEATKKAQKRLKKEALKRLFGQ